MSSGHSRHLSVLSKTVGCTSSGFGGIHFPFNSHFVCSAKLKLLLLQFAGEADGVNACLEVALLLTRSCLAYSK